MAAGHERDGRARRDGERQDGVAQVAARVYGGEHDARRVLRLRLRHGRLDEPHARVQPELRERLRQARDQSLVAFRLPAVHHHRRTKRGVQHEERERQKAVAAGEVGDARLRCRRRRRKVSAPQAFAERLRDHQRRLPGLEELLSRQHVRRAHRARDRRERVVPGKTPRVRRGKAAARRPPERRLGRWRFRDVHESRGGLVAAPSVVARVPRARGRAILEPRARNHRAQVLVGRLLPVQSIHRGG